MYIVLAASAIGLSPTRLTPNVFLSIRKIRDRYFLTKSSEIVAMNYVTRVKDSYFTHGTPIIHKYDFFHVGLLLSYHWHSFVEWRVIQRRYNVQAWPNKSKVGVSIVPRRLRFHSSASFNRWIEWNSEITFCIFYLIQSEKILTCTKIARVIGEFWIKYSQ